MQKYAEDWRVRQDRAYRMLADGNELRQVEKSIQHIDDQSGAAIELIAMTPYLCHATRIGIFSGSFNPPTMAHMALAQTVLDLAGLDVLLWTMSRVTVDKETVTKASLAMRLVMMRTIALANPLTGVALVNRGLYTQQAEAFWQTFPTLKSLVIVVGFDKVAQIVDAKYYQDRERSLNALFSRAELWVAPRDNNTHRDLVGLMNKPENRQWSQRVHYLPLQPSLRTLSSTALRHAIKNGQPAPAGMPPEALALIDAGGYA